MDNSEENNDDLAFIRTAHVHRIKKHEVNDISSLMSKFRHEFEVLGEPVHLRLDKDCDLSTFQLEEVLQQVVEEPYHQFVSKVKDNVYHFQRGTLPKKRKSDDLQGGPLTVEHLMNTGKRPTELTDAPALEIESLYWQEVRRIASTPAAKFLATYASDILGTSMDYSSKRITLCNLNTALQKVVVKYAQPIPGITTSMLYIGVWRSTFTQHLEDKDLWSISYLHYGAPKYWYVTPATSTVLFQTRTNDYLKDYRKRKFHGCETIFRHKNTLVDPLWYKKNNIPIIRIIQYPGDLVILPPFTFHFGFNSGFNYSEAVNMAPSSWIPFGLLAKECKSCVVKETLNMEPFVIEYLPERYRDYLSGKMSLAHPFDPEKYLQVVPPPQVVQVSDEVSDYMVKLRGLDYIYAAKIVREEKLVFAVIGDIKTWMEKTKLAGMKWTSTGQDVRIPDWLFSSTNRIDPFFHLKSKDRVIIYLRSVFNDLYYSKTDIKFFNVYKSSEETKEILERIDVCRDELAAFQPGYDWIEDSQMILIFGKTSSENEQMRGESRDILCGENYGDSSIMVCYSGGIFGAKNWPLSKLNSDQIPRMTGLVIPKMDGLRVKKFALNSSQMSTLDNLKLSIGFGDSSNGTLKGIVVMYKKGTNIDCVHQILSEHPRVPVAGGSVSEVYTSQEDYDTVAAGFLIYGEKVSVQCCVLPKEPNKRDLKKQLIDLNVPCHMKNNLAFVFGPEQLEGDHARFDALLQRKMKKYIPGTEIIGFCTDTQIGRPVSFIQFIKPDNILLVESHVLLIISY